MNIRAILFQIHLWTGLVLGLVLGLIGLSGSVLVYDREILAIGVPPPPTIDTPGPPLPLDDLIQSARAAFPVRHVAPTIVIPRGPHDAAIVRFQEPGHLATEVYLDPSNGSVLEIRDSPYNGLLAFLHRFHGSLALGRDGRQAVGWLGVGMLVLGLSGLVLWWPKRDAWKGAFGVRREARDYRFHREVHGAAGIWLWLVFIVVSFSGVAIVFPDTTRAVVTLGMAHKSPQSGADLRRAPLIEPVPAITPAGADAARAIVRQQWNVAEVQSIAIPARPKEAIRVTVGDIDGGPVSLAFVDPYRRTIVASRNPPGRDRFMAWQRPLHAGKGWGEVWRALVFLSGLLPQLFVTTGIVMWLNKRRARRPASARVPQEAGASP